MAVTTAGGNDGYEEAPILSKIAHKGAAAGVLVCIVSMVFGLMTAWELFLTVLNNPVGFFQRKDRSSMDSQEPLPGAQHEYLEANGVRIHAVSLGRQPQKPLMLFIHGFPEFWYSWHHLMKHYSKEYDAVAIDLRGYGLSDKPPGMSSYHLDVVAADVADVIRALGHETCVAVGHDWGAAVAWVLAGTSPHMVQRIVSVAGPHMGLANVNTSPEQDKKSWYALMFQVPYLAELWCMHSDMAAIARMYTPGNVWGPLSPTAFTDSDREWYKWAFSRPGVLVASLNYYRCYIRNATYAPRPVIWRALRRRLPMPVLAIAGADDTALGPELFNNFDQVAPVSEVHTLERCSHWVAAEYPDKVTALMDGFLTKYPPAPSARKI